jgi:hypothetical protein
MFMSSLRGFYLPHSLDFTDFVNQRFWNPNDLAQAGWGRKSHPRSERKPIVHGVSEVLLTA